METKLKSMAYNQSSEFVAFLKNISSNHINVSSHNKLSHDFGRAISKINLIAMFFGIFGNVLCVMVFSIKSMLKIRFNWYLYILSLVDVCFCLLTFINYLIYFFDEEKSLKDLSKFSCYFHDYILNLLDAYSVYLAFILSIDRLYAIKQPIKIKDFFTHKYPKYVVLIGFLVILIGNLPIVLLNPRAYVTPSLVKNSSNSESNIDNANYDYIHIEKVNEVKNAFEDSLAKKASLNELELDYLLRAPLKKFDFYISSNDLQPFCMYITIYDMDHILSYYNNRQVLEVIIF
jgi:hypothetical protein